MTSLFFEAKDGNHEQIKQNIGAFDDLNLFRTVHDILTSVVQLKFRSVKRLKNVMQFHGIVRMHSQNYQRRWFFKIMIILLCLCNKIK